MNASFWQDKRVLLTGHTGFKGSWLSLWLQTLGAQVVGYALAPPTRPSLFEVANVGLGMVSVIADIRDLQNLCAVFTKYKPEIVIHMAAQPLVRYSYNEPVDTYSTNVMGTVNLLEAVRLSNGVKAVINVTSDKCYENREWVWGYRENEAMGGYDPYSNSKGCAELVTAAYRNSYFHPEKYHQHGVAVASARAGNVIGGGDWAEDRLIPDIMRAVSQGQPVNIRNPLAIRPWQHVLEPLSGYLLLAEKLCIQGASFAEGWNFGPNEDDAKPVQWIVEKLVNTWGGDASWVMCGGNHPHEALHLKLDCSKARRQLDWHPRWTLNKALEKIIDWHKAINNGENMHTKTLEHISQYDPRVQL
ncbi:MAG: CDP-glucose 4,6-dehydratase [Methylomicrobium sp.]|nr:CDP-glucose 4,6-dehydratase [Methylomicrobium sp.]